MLRDMTGQRYRLVVAGELSDRVGHAFDGMSLVRAGGDTVLEGPLRDQAEFQALLHRVSGLGLTLLSAEAVDATASRRAQAPGGSPGGDR